MPRLRAPHSRDRLRTPLLMALLLFGALLVVLPGPAHAAQVTVRLDCQLMEQGAAIETLSLSGGTPSPSTALCTASGNTTPVSVDPSTTMTVTVQTDQPNSRYRGNSTWALGTSYGVTTPASGTLSVVLYNYYQVQDTYEVQAGAQPDFDTAMSWLVNGTILGVPGSTVCTIFSSSSPTDSCTPRWVDYGSVVGFPAWAAAPPPQSRWGAQSGMPSSFTVTAVGQVFTVHYYKQIQENFAYMVLDGGSGYSSPTLVCTFLGASSYCPALSTTSQPFWLDFGSAWSVNNVLPGSNGVERWSTLELSGTATSGAFVTIPYYNQYSVTVSYTAVEGGTPPSFTIQYKSGGTLTSSFPTQVPKGYWMDAQQSFTLSIPAGTQTERWRSPVSTFSVFDGASYVLQLHHQYSLQLSFSVFGGGSSYSPPQLIYSNFSKVISTPLTASTVSYWSDSGTNWSVTNPLAGSGLSERWETNQVVSGQTSASLVAPLQYYHQFFDTFAYGVVDGGSGYGTPTVTFSEFGANVFGSQGWVDAGTTYSFTNPLPSSTTSERWETGNGTGVERQAALVNVTYYHQFALVLSYSLVSPTTPSGAPWLSFVALGQTTAQPLTMTPTAAWLDSGTSWTVTPVFSGASATERYATQQPTAGTASAPGSQSYTFFDQFRISVAYSILGGGSPKAPSLAYTAFASPVTEQLTNSSRNVWVDATTQWSLPSLLPGSTSQERWIAQGPSGATVLSSFDYQVAYQHQYYVDTMANSAAGGEFLNGTQWYNNGANVRLNATSFTGWRFAYWQGVGSGAYNGTASAVTFALGGPAVEVAVFYPGLTIDVSGGGHVTYFVGGLTGNATSGRSVIYVPLGSNVTLKAYPAIFDIVFEGWTEAAAGRSSQTSVVVGGPLSVGASFGLDYSDLGIIGIAVPIVLVLAIYVLVVRRLPRKRP